jgi:hypothetical protein
MMELRSPAQDATITDAHITGAEAMSSSPLPAAQAVDIVAQFARVTDHWSPKVEAQVNDQYAKVARLLGEMDWPPARGLGRVRPTP